MVYMPQGHSVLPQLQQRDQIQRLSIAMQRKLGRGTQINIRLVIRGDMQTGKTSLHRRLRGLPFEPPQTAAAPARNPRTPR